MQPSLDTMRLLIVSHVVHYRWAGGYYAYGPYAREIEIWAELFREIVIAAPCREEQPAPDAHRIGHGNVTVIPQKEAGGTTWASKVGLLLATPRMIAGLAKEMAKADAIHVRCPGNLGLVGAFLAPLFSRRLIAKYAGQWERYPGEAWSFRVQRAILRSGWWRGPVTVYGQWPKQSRHVVSFFTSVLTAQQLSQARAVAQARRINRPLTVAYSGRLTKPKNVDVLIRAIAALGSEGITLNGLIIGEGPEYTSLQNLARTLGVADRVQFAGGVSVDEVLNYLQKVDIFALISNTEGWPKALTEAMAFGLICVGSNRGLIPQFLGEGRGFVVPPGDTPALTATLRTIAAAPEQFEQMGRAASAWANAYSLEGVRDALRDLMVRSWQLSNAEGREASLSACAHIPAK